MNRNWDSHRIVRAAIIGVYAIWTQWIAVRAGEPGDLWWWVVGLFFFVWMVAPIAVPLLVWFRDWLVTIGIGLIAAHGVYAYERDMFGPGARSTSALIFVFLPIYQWAAVLLLLVVAGASRRLIR